jgi:hypothetical protein
VLLVLAALLITFLTVVGVPFAAAGKPVARLGATGSYLVSRIADSTSKARARKGVSRRAVTRRPASSTSTARWASDLVWTSASNGWGPVERDRSNGEKAAGDGRTISLNGSSFSKGLGVHAPSDVRFALGRQCSRLSGSVGMDDEVASRGSVVFEILLDGRRQYSSGKMRGTTETKRISIDLTGRDELRLVVTGAGDGIDFDHADWAGVQLTCATGSGSTAPSAATPPPPASPPPSPPSPPPAAPQPETVTPSSSVFRWYADSSPFNSPIPANAEVDLNSTTLVQTLVQSANEKGWPVASGAWTVPVYYADAQTKRYDVVFDSSWNNGRIMYGVPIPDAAVPDPEGDHHLAVVDRSTNCEWDLWNARKTASGWRAGQGNRLELEGAGFTPSSARVSGFGLLAGLIRPEEIQQGVIDHALVFGYPYTDRDGSVWPAVSGGAGASTLPGAIPIGARVQLNPALNLDALGLNPWQKTIARALQRYGMYLGDTAGALTLYAQHWRSTSVGYPWGQSTFANLPPSVAPHLRVLKLGPVIAPTYRVQPSRCGTFNW